MKKILLALLFLACGYNLPAQVTFYKGSFRELQRKAAESSRLIFVDLYADWCGPCNIMDREVFSRQDVGRFMEEHFVCTRLNIEQEPGRTLARDYEVRSIPTFLIFDTNGKLAARTAGGRSALNFLKDMQTILDRLKTQTAVFISANSSPSPLPRGGVRRMAVPLSTGIRAMPVGKTKYNNQSLPASP